MGCSLRQAGQMFMAYVASVRNWNWFMDRHGGPAEWRYGCA